MQILFAAAPLIMIAMIVGVLGVGFICSIRALAPTNFLQDGQCAAADTPFDVFRQSSVLGPIGFTLVGGVLVVISLLKARVAK